MIKRALVLIPLVAGLFVIGGVGVAQACGDHLPDPVYGCESPPTTTETPPTTTVATTTTPPTTTAAPQGPCGTASGCVATATPIVDCSVDVSGSAVPPRADCPPTEVGYHDGAHEPSLPHTGTQTDTELAFGFLFLALAAVIYPFKRLLEWMNK